MRESPTYPAILRRGREEGRIGGERQFMLGVGTKKFGEPSLAPRGRERNDHGDLVRRKIVSVSRAAEREHREQDRNDCVSHDVLPCRIIMVRDGAMRLLTMRSSQAAAQDDVFGLVRFLL